MLLQVESECYKCCDGIGIIRAIDRSSSNKLWNKQSNYLCATRWVRCASYMTINGAIVDDRLLPDINITCETVNQTNDILVKWSITNTTYALQDIVAKFEIMASGSVHLVPTEASHWSTSNSLYVFLRKENWLIPLCYQAQPLASNQLGYTFPVNKIYHWFGLVTVSTKWELRMEVCSKWKNVSHRCW